MYIIAGLFNIIHTQYRELDIDLRTIFNNHKTNIEELNNPLSKLDIEIYAQYMEQVVRMSRNIRTGLESGFHIPFILTATFFNQYKKSNNVRELFMELEKYDSTTNNITCYNVRQIDNLFYYEISVDPEFAQKHPIVTRQWLEMQYGIALQYAYSYTGRFIYPVSVFSIYDRTGTADLLEQYFSCPIKFNQQTTALVFYKSILDLPVKTIKKELFPIFENTMAEIEYKQTNSDLTQAVSRYLTHSLSLPSLNLSTVAQRFHMSERNFQRKLKLEGTTYQTVLDNLRMTLAKKYLKEKISLIEISSLLGFGNQSAFNKFFHKHFHTTPTQMIRRN